MRAVAVQGGETVQRLGKDLSSGSRLSDKKMERVSAGLLAGLDAGLLYLYFFFFSFSFPIFCLVSSLFENKSGWFWIFSKFGKLLNVMLMCLATHHSNW
jgi:hypothetical protein